MSDLAKPKSYDSDPATGLPPVTPPSGKFIVQLFVVPGVIVAVAVGCIWFVSWLVGGYFTPEQFLKDLRSGNAEVRWRRASDLAQILKRDPSLAANPKFALHLAEMLRQALRDSDYAERAYAERQVQRMAAPDESYAVTKQLHDERAFIEFLIPCLGSFSVPAGVPLLSDIALKEDGADAATVALRRQLAVWALANAGENLKRYDALPADRKAAALAALETEAAAPSADRSQWAGFALACLQARDAKSAMALELDQIFGRCAQADDPTLRKFVALALTFWEAGPAQNERMDQILLALSKDDGHGVDQVALSKEEGKGLPVSSSVRGREIRYQAVQALARRGSKQTASRLGLFAEMLDEDSLAKTFHTRLRDGRDVPDGATVVSVLTGALKSISELQRRQPDIDVTSLYPAMDKLAQNANPVVRLEAERARIALNRK